MGIWSIFKDCTTPHVHVHLFYKSQRLLDFLSSDPCMADDSTHYLGTYAKKVRRVRGEDSDTKSGWCVLDWTVLCLRASCTGTARVHFTSTLHVCIWETLRWRCKKEKNYVTASCSIECRTAYISEIYANLTFGSFCDVKTFAYNVWGLFTTCKTFADFCRLLTFWRLFETCETFKATWRDIPFFSWGLHFTTIPRTKLLKTS